LEESIVIFLSFYKKLLIGVMLMIAISLAATAGEVERANDGGSVWQAGIDGPKVETNPDGSFRRIYARVTHSVEFPDRKGILKAQDIAETKAKAEIMKFLTGPYVTSGKFITELSSDISSASRTRSNGADEISKVNQREMIEQVRKITTEVSSGSIPGGIVILERGYDRKEEVAWVEVGISERTMRAAQSVKKSFSSKGSGSGSNGTSVPSPGSEIQRYPEKDW
jgi:hypothetical protein